MPFRPIFEDEAVERLPRIIPIIKPMPIPPTQWDDEPTRCIRVNARWLSYVIGVLDALDQPDAWQGTEAEIDAARVNVREITIAMQSSDTCAMMLTDIRQNLETCQWEIEHDNSGVYTPIGAIYQAACSPEPTEIRVVDCQLEQNIGGAGWTEIPDAHFYPISGSCPADVFFVRNSLAALVAESAVGVNAFRLGRVASGDIELDAYSTLKLRFGTARNQLLAFFPDGMVQLDTNPAQATGTTLARLWVGGHNSAYHVARFNGRTGQAVPIVQIASHNTHSSHPLAISISGLGVAQALDNVGGLELIDRLKFYDFAGSANRSLVGGLDFQREAPAISNYHGEVALHVQDYIGQKTILRGGSTTDGTQPTIAVLGETEKPRQTITGDLQGNQPLKDFLQAMEAFGWITDNTTLGEPPEVPVFLQSVEIDEFCVIQQTYSNEAVVASTNLNTLACLNEPPNPVDPVFLEAIRCRTALGAMSLLFREYYRLACDAADEFVICDAINLSAYLRGAIPFFRTDGEAFYQWALAMCIAINDEVTTANGHFDEIIAAFDSISQAYYCALTEQGTLDASGFVEWLADVSGFFTGVHQDLIEKFLANFQLGSMIEVNADGYFYPVLTPCEFEICGADIDWQMGWNFPTNSGSTEWQVDNGHYTAFAGWVHDSSLTTMTLTFEFWVTDCCITAASNNDDGLTVNLYRLSDESLLDSVAGIYSGTPFEINWHAIGVEEEAQTGIRIEVLAIDNGGEDNFTNARILTCNMNGHSVSPSSGDPLATCD